MSDAAPTATPSPRQPVETVWELLFGQTEGLRIRLALTLLAESQLTPAMIDEALARLARETTVGPMLDPSAYVDGRRFHNAAEYADTLRALRAVIRILASSRLRRKDPYACS